MVGSITNDVFTSSPKDTKDDSWYKATVAHSMWFVGGCMTLAITLAKSVLAAVTHSPHISWALLQTIFAALIGYLLADLVSGIYHWAVDNYGSPQTPLVGPQIESFQLHHQQPLGTTKYEIANLLYISMVITTIILVPINMVCDDPVMLGFVCAFAGFSVFSLKFHAWAHTPKEKLPQLVAAFQAAGVIIDSSKHKPHHQLNHTSNYCGVSGMCNWFMDSCKGFLALEILIFRVLGVRPRSWDDPKPR